MLPPRLFLATAATFSLVAAASCGSGPSSGTGGDTHGTGAGTVGTPGDCSIFPPSSFWNTDISGVQVREEDQRYLDSMNIDTHLHPDFGSVYGIPYQYVDSSVAKSEVVFDYDDSDPGPYPIPADPLVEEGGDAHILMIHNDECVLYELFAARREGDGWAAGSGAVWDLKTNSMRPRCWTSADAAGLPILAGLARYEEFEAGAINHVLRFTMDSVQTAFTPPASHLAGGSSDASLPPLGIHLRLKASTDLSEAPPQSRMVLVALQKYGMVLADSGSDWFIGGAPDLRWDDEDLEFIKSLRGSDFEVLPVGEVTTECE